MEGEAKIGGRTESRANGRTGKVDVMVKIMV